MDELLSYDYALSGSWQVILWERHSMLTIQARKHQCQFLLRADYKCTDVGSYPMLACTVQVVNGPEILVGVMEASTMSRVGWPTQISLHLVMVALRGADLPELWIIK